MTGKKYDSEKLRYDLIDPFALERVAAVLTYGAKKYSDNNWKQVENKKPRYTAAAMRHLEAFRKGEEKDSETGEPHLAHAICCLMFLLAGDK